MCVLVAAYFAVTSIDSRGTAHARGRGPLRRLRRSRSIRRTRCSSSAPAAGYARRAALASRAGVRRRRCFPRSATLLLWKHRGLGHVPHVDADVDFHRLELIRLDLRAYFYSDRLIEMPFIAGVIAIARRSWAKSALVAVWFLAYVLVQGILGACERAHGKRFSSCSCPFSRPSWSRAAALPLLVPRLARAARRAHGDAPSPTRRATGASSARSSSSPRLPLVVVAALPRGRRRRSSCSTADRHALAPVDDEPPRRARPRAPRRLAHVAAGREPHASVYYNVYRSRARRIGRAPLRRREAVRRDCVLRMKHVSSSDRALRTRTSRRRDAGRTASRAGGELGSTSRHGGRRAARLAAGERQRALAARRSRRRATRAARAAARGSSSGRRASRSPSSSAAARRG